jgi:hypothetical protein
VTAAPDGRHLGLGTGGARRSRRGFIVVAVLWMLAALSALVLIYLTYVTNTALVVAGSTDRAGGDPIRRHSGPTETCWHR